MYLSALAQDKRTGSLEALSTRPIDLSGVRGGRLHCAGSVTPWNSHLGSEEYEPDAREPDADLTSMADYFGGDPGELNPYNYGWAVEVKVLDEAGGTEVIKHYAMGRRSLELAYVMPDRRTVYLTDDGTNVALFMFVADRPGDLSAGNLYAAHWIQREGRQLPGPARPPRQGESPDSAPDPHGRDGGAGALRWVSLGHTNADEIRREIRKGIEFADIFDVEEPDGGSCPRGFRSVNSGHGSPFRECLRLREGMAKAASRLESRRYAAYQGATTEWRKMEGLTHDPAGGRLFLAMSEVSRGMEDHMDLGRPSSSFDRGGPNHIRLPYNLCGAVYAMQLAGGVEDTTGTPIDSRYVAVGMVSALAGRMTRAWDKNSDLPAYPADGPFAANKCDLDGIANPDNLTFIPGPGILIIGEDTSEGHQNDALWAYDTDRGSLTRILTTPYGSEVTSPYFYPDIGGFGYLISVVQHPFAESDQDKLDPGRGEDQAYTGYLGPLPPMSR
jgi:secreted PhoX family phosphatase